MTFYFDVCGLDINKNTEQYMCTMLKDKEAELSDLHAVSDSVSIASLVAVSAQHQIGRKDKC